MDDPANPIQPRPTERMFANSWHPPADAFFAVIHIYGPREQVMHGVEQIARNQHVVLHIDPTMELPSDAWDRLPPRFLSTIQQAIVREDLRNIKRDQIAEKLRISPQTVTSYRYRIRRQFLSIPPEERPAWMLTWLERFPGKRAIPARPNTRSKR